MSRYHQFTLPATVDHSDVLGGYGQHLCFATSHEFAVQIADALNTAADKDRQIAALLQEAEIHAQESSTANATIYDIYQLCTGSTGEPGNWNGAKPVREMKEHYERQIAVLTERVDKLRDIITKAIKLTHETWTCRGLSEVLLADTKALADDDKENL